MDQSTDRPVVAAVMGDMVPKYTIFGDTVNVASRLQSSGEPMKIQISEEFRYEYENRRLVTRPSPS